MCVKLIIYYSVLFLNIRKGLNIRFQEHIIFGYMPRKRRYSYGDYRIRHDAKTFIREFYYINFVDRKGYFDSKYSERLKQRNHAWNRARWLSENSWALGEIPYLVVKIGLYSSETGHIVTFWVG